MEMPESTATPREWRDWCLYKAQDADQYVQILHSEPMWWRDSAERWLRLAHSFVLNEALARRAKVTAEDITGRW